MSVVTRDHFLHAAIDVGSHGDNDTLPFDVDSRFIKENAAAIADMAYDYFCENELKSHNNAAKAINALQIFSERLLVPTGPAGFRITTKIHPFWNIYINGLGVAIAEVHETQRSDNAHSYRYSTAEESLFDRSKSWRTYREATLDDDHLASEDSVVVQTDISSFYEHIYHHRLQNCIEDLIPRESTVAIQIDRFLSKFASGRSFGLPVGGQCSRILAEVMMSPIDRMLSDEGLIWHRYVDDFTIITETQEKAYRAIAILSHALADYGLSLNRTKTTILRGNHYLDYVNAQLGTSGDAGSKLREIDLHFDPYSDSPHEDYDELKEIVRNMDIRTLLELETTKAQPDTFLLAQIGRTLRLHSPQTAIQLCDTLLEPSNLNAFRASWSKIMRGIAAVRAEEEYEDIFEALDKMLDAVPSHSPSLLLPEVNCLHYLRTIRFRRTKERARYVLSTYNRTVSETVKRACLECWRTWRDRPNFIRVRNRWQNLSEQEQRMLWLAAGNFGDEGKKARDQVRTSLVSVWQLGIEGNGKGSFGSLYAEWCENES